MMLKALLAAAAALLVGAAQASVEYKLADPALAARVDGVPLHAFSVDAVWRQALARDPRAARSATLEALIAERLLAAEARKQFGDALVSGRAVAFAPDVALDDKLSATLREVHGKELEQSLARLPGGSLDGLVIEQPAPDAAVLALVFGKPGQLRLDISLNELQLRHAAQVVLLRYRMPSGPVGAVTLADVYHRQNVQGRVALAAQQPGFALQQARQALAVLWVQHWAQRRFGAAAVEDLRRVLADQETVLAVQRLHGIGADTDAGSSLLDRLAAQVTAEQVRAYFNKNKEQFQRIEKVRARHIRLADETAAQAAAQALQAGANFATLARRLSRAPDAQQGGDLGWIRHEGKLDWLSNIAYAQPEGKPSPPIRAPVGADEEAHWEIVLAEQRVQGYHAPDSEAVRYIASRAIARETAAAQLAAQRARLLREASIDVNRTTLDQPLREL